MVAIAREQQRRLSKGTLVVAISKYEAQDSKVAITIYCISLFANMPYAITKVITYMYSIRKNHSAPTI